MSTDSKNNPKQQYRLLKLLTSILKEVGLHGFIFVVGTTIFLVWGSSEQKQEFIDSYILLKSSNQNHFQCVIVVTFLLLVIIMGGIYYHRMLRLRKEENKRLGREKSILQEILLNRELNSSAKNEEDE